MTGLPAGTYRRLNHATVPASQLPDQLSESLTSQISALIEAEQGMSTVPGAAFGIVVDGQLAGFFSHGVADVATGAAPTEQSIARVASVTKTFTATAIMQLRDASLLALDDPLLLYIPEFTAAQAISAPLEGVTIRRMLTHYSGLSTEHPDLDWDTPNFPTLEHVLDSLEKIQVVIPQDSQWKYSNLAYSLLGEVISRLSGKPYIEYVHDEIIGPLGLANTAYDLSPEQQKLKMTGYSPPSPDESEARIAPIGHLNGFSAAGQLQTNVEDLAKWVGFQLGSGPDSVLSKQSLNEMHSPVYVADDWSNGQGLGWRAVRRGEHVYWNHGGAVHGFSTSVIFNVPTRTGVIALMNMWPSGLSSDLALNIASIVIENADPASDSSSAFQVPNLVPGQYDGNYWAEPGLPLTVQGTSTGLRFAGPEGSSAGLHFPATLEPAEDDDTFMVVNGRGAGEKVLFSRNEASQPEGFTLGGFRYKKIT